MANEFYGSGGGAVNSSRWLTEEVFKLIDMVQRDEAIYNPRHKYYFCRPYVENFWREVDLKLEKNPGASLAKWTNLRISFRREYTNYLEEKVPPCWSYFDRMFFLHPYLRKKHQQPKSLDSQVQDALVQISSLSNRLQRERAVAAAASAAATLNTNNERDARTHNTHTQQPLDNYLEYFDDPEQNNSELDDIIDDEPQSRFQNLETHSLNNDIKSECDENVEDYDAEPRNEEDDVDAETDADDMHNFVLDTLNSHNSNSSTTATTQEKRHQIRLQHLNRLQTRSYHEDLRSKRPRSQESISSSGQACNNNAVHAQRILCSSTPAHSNVSFVRPTFAKPMELVSTSVCSVANDSGDASSSANSSSGALQLQPSTSHATHQRHLLHGHHHNHRLEISSIHAAGSGNANSATTTVTGVTATANQLVTSPPANHLELCDCKSDPDAMFLMSLLPDIQKLNGRDRGKIKIAFQNILQDYLYPD